jgi:hypothetical protein
MRLPSTPLGIFLVLCAVLLPAGAGLTAPVWLMVMGVRLDVAASIGAEIVGVTVLALAVLGILYRLVLHPRLAAMAPVAAVGAPATADDEDDVDPAHQRLVHGLIWALFLVPFVLIIVGFIVGQLEKVAGLD